ncbi:MAG: hypothetical protein D6704_02720 [Nitrospirae bacterium]|nr:MAG: hypothetical protein D6704_02720 [Nitrospirota bacterium]
MLRIGWEEGIPTSLTVWEWSTRSAGLAERFRSLAERWRTDTRFVSSIHEMVLHPAYQQINGMGQEALPFILQELERRPDHWFWALQAITGEDPVPPEDRGNITSMARHWLRWAEERGISNAF